MGETNSQNPDAVRNVIKSHNTMLVSMPQEVSMRAGLLRGVQVRVGQDIDRPTIITMEVINPVDRSADLEKLLAERKAKTDRRDAKAKRKADSEKKMAKAAKKRKADAAKKKKADAAKKAKADKRGEEARAKKEADDEAAQEPSERQRIADELDLKLEDITDDHVADYRAAHEPEQLTIEVEPEVPPEKDSEYAVKW